MTCRWRRHDPDNTSICARVFDTLVRRVDSGDISGAGYPGRGDAGMDSSHTAGTVGPRHALRLPPGRHVSAEAAKLDAAIAANLKELGYGG